MAAHARWTASITIVTLLYAGEAAAEPEAKSDGGVAMSWDSVLVRAVSTKVRGSNSDRSGGGAAVGSEGITTLLFPAAPSPFAFGAARLKMLVQIGPGKSATESLMRFTFSRTCGW